MKLILMILVISLALPAQASEITAPPAPETAEDWMPQRAESFGEGLWQILKQLLNNVQPELVQASAVCLRLLSVAMLLSLLQLLYGKPIATVNFIGAAGICLILLDRTNMLIGMGTQTVQTLKEYGMLLLGVMTSALAAQGGVSTSAALYAGTAVFNTLLINLISSVLVPMIYMYLALCAAHSAVGEELLKKMASFVKWLSSWSLKIILYVFTGYMTVTGVVSGTTDAAAMKAAKLTISGVVPVVGGILSDATEAVLVGAGVVRNSAGIYGMLAILAVFAEPFLKIGLHCILLKLTGAVCAVFVRKEYAELIEDYSAAMGLVLGMIGSVCVLELISTVCFLKGVG